jgi:hypothetical protein
MKRHLGWEFNGMRLHELYFGNLGGTVIGKRSNPGWSEKVIITTKTK